MANFYGVNKGFNTGVYNTWAECEEQIRGFSGAKFKKFPTYEEAKAFADGIALNTTSLKTINPEDILYIYVDGSFNSKDNIAGYGVVLVKNDKIIFKDLGAFRDMEMNKSRNVFGELRGALKAVELAIANDFTDITIVYDYVGVEYFATGEWKAKTPLTEDYALFMGKYMKEINISFKKVKAHSGEDKYNDMADLLAKKAVGVI